MRFKREAIATLDSSQKLPGGHELAVTVDASLPSDFSATADLGFVHGALTAIAGKPTSLTASITVDNLNLAPSVGLTTSADANFHLVGGFSDIAGIDAANFPSIMADFHLNWSYNSVNPATGAPSVSFDNVGLDLSRYDLRTAASAGDPSDLSLPNLTDLDPGNIGKAIQNFTAYVDGLDVPQGAKHALHQLTSGLNNGIDFEFPIFDNPGQAVFGMVLGRDTDIFSITATLQLRAEGLLDDISLFGLDIGFGGEIDIDGQLKLAYDTYGLREMISQATAGTLSATGDVLIGPDAENLWQLTGAAIYLGSFTFQMPTGASAGEVTTMTTGLPDLVVNEQDNFLNDGTWIDPLIANGRATITVSGAAGPQPVPEPSTFLLVSVGLAGFLGGAGRRRAGKKAPSRPSSRQEQLTKLRQSSETTLDRRRERTPWRSVNHRLTIKRFAAERHRGGRGDCIRLNILGRIDSGAAVFLMTGGDRKTETWGGPPARLTRKTARRAAPRAPNRT